MNLISTAQAAKVKACSRNAIIDAIKRNAIDGQMAGAYFVVRPNRKFDEWHPNPERQQIGRDSQKKTRRRKR